MQLPFHLVFQQKGIRINNTTCSIIWDGYVSFLEED